MAGASPRPSRASHPPIVQVLPIAGMTCRTCEQRIERHVRRIPGVERASASAARGRLEVVAVAPVSEAALREAVEAAGYEVGRSPWVTPDTSVWATAAAGLFGIAGLMLAARLLGIGDIVPASGDLATGGPTVALLLGVAAGFSTCLALTGGLVLALSASFSAGTGATAATTWARLRPVAVFVVGRIAGFGVLGAILGAVGASVAMPPWLVAVLMVAAAVLMTLLGVRLTGVSPRIAGWSPTLPAGLARSLGVDAQGAASYSDARAAVLGAATFFLPCGFTQAVQVFALSTGDPLTAATIMALFALGTAPGLLALGGLPGIVPQRARPVFNRVVGVVVIAFAVLNMTAAFRLVGITPALIAPPVTSLPNVTMDGDVQVVRTFQLADGYAPADAALYAGVPTRWIIESREGASCAIFLRVPSLDLAVTLREGDNVIELPPLPAGRIPYTCSMGMYGGMLTVVDRPSAGTPGRAGG